MKKTIRILKAIGITSLSVLLVGIITAGLYTACINTAPLDTEMLSNVQNSAIYYDINNKQLENFYRGKNAGYASVDELPRYVLDAFVAIEDKRFYQHNGLDYKRIAGAVVENIKNQAYSQGGSTISQQLIKNTHLSNEKNINRKIKEAKLAYELENKYTKEEILELYLNIVYYGNGAYGIDSASKCYFNKRASELSIAQAASLASVINSPGKFSLTNNYSAVMERKNKVLSCMLKQNCISLSEYQEAMDEVIEINTAPSLEKENYYLAAVTAELEDITKSYGIRSLGGCKILTYYDDTLQSALYDDALIDKPPEADNLSIIIDNEKNCVSAIYGNTYYLLSSKRQPGSTLKPLAVYAPALEKGIITPETIINDNPINFDGYSPKNYNNKYLGEMTVRTALATSNNIVAVKVLEKTGLDYSKEFLLKNGITLDQKDSGHSVALGGLTHGIRLKDLLQAYSTFTRNGEYTYCGFIRQIIDKNGKLLYNHTPNTKKTMSENTAIDILDMLKSTTEIGTAQRLSGYPFDLAVKTGTVGAGNEGKNSDAYCVSMTSKHTIGVWIGSSDSSALLDKKICGGTYPAVITANILDSIYAVERPRSFK